MNKKWKNLVKSVAPALGAALGGPMAGAAVKTLAENFLGQSDSPKANLERDLEQRLEAASTQDLATLRELDYQFETRMQELGVDVFRIEAEDRANARDAHGDSIMPNILAVLLTLLVAAGGYGLMRLHLPPENASIVYMVFGAALTGWNNTIAYWVGTTKASSQKNRLIAKQ